MMLNQGHQLDVHSTIDRQDSTVDIRSRTRAQEQRWPCHVMRLAVPTKRYSHTVHPDSQRRDTHARAHMCLGHGMNFFSVTTLL